MWAWVVSLELGAHDVRKLHALAFGATDECLDTAERAQPFEESAQRVVGDVTGERVARDHPHHGEQIPRAMLKLRDHHTLL